VRVGNCQRKAGRVKEASTLFVIGATVRSTLALGIDDGYNPTRPASNV
jgi:hypothetical protein